MHNFVLFMQQIYMLVYKKFSGFRFSKVPYKTWLIGLFLPKVCSFVTFLCKIVIIAVL